MKNLNMRLFVVPTICLIGGLMLGAIITLSVANYRLAQTPEQSHEQTPNAQLNGLPVEFLHAVGADSQSDLALATGLIDPDAEGIYALDSVTGALSLWVYSRAGVGVGAFTRNILGDFAIEPGKAPRFLMVTGNVNFTGGGVGAPAPSVLYVADANTGIVVPYTVPWNKSNYSAGKMQGGGFIKLGTLQARNAPLEN